MCRSRSSRAALAVLAAAALATAATPATAQDEGELAPQVLDLEFTVVSLDGSVATAESEEKIEVTLGSDVLFAFGDASLLPAARQRLGEAAAAVREAEAETVRIVGYTDSKGSDAFNRRLSLRRAEAVADALRGELGGEAPEIVTAGRGEKNPVAANAKEDGSDNPRGRALNRRVAIEIPR
jgi:outer membrane protein OmpA-like peptidoglycan-associated protein